MRMMETGTMSHYEEMELSHLVPVGRPSRVSLAGKWAIRMVQTQYFLYVEKVQEIDFFKCHKIANKYQNGTYADQMCITYK